MTYLQFERSAARVRADQGLDELMRFEGAVINEQGVTFAVAVIRRPVLQDRRQADEAIQVFTGLFGGLPVVLMAQDSRGTPEYYGREDLSRFMANVPLEAIPWSEYTVS